MKTLFGRSQQNVRFCIENLPELGISGGRGKSKMIHSTALTCLLAHHCVEHIVLLIKAQIRRETEDFKDFWIICEKVDQLIYYCDFEFDTGDDHIILCGEADQLMFQHTK
jgi:hypothetical protein